MPALNLTPAPAAENLPAARRAYDPVASAIVSGELAPGALITEGEVSAILGMSRTPVREAFLLLEARGLLRLYPKKGAQVTAVEDGEAGELLQARVVLESGAARIVADQLRVSGTSDASGVTSRPPARPKVQEQADSRADFRAELDRLLDQQRAAASEGDLLSFAHADHLFHAQVVAGAGNRVIDEVYATLGPRFERLAHRVAARHPSRLDDLLRDHERLAELILAGDAAGYDECLRSHVSSLN